MSTEWVRKWGATVGLWTYGIILLIMPFLPDPLVNYTWIIPGSDYGLETVREILIPNYVRQFTFEYGLATISLTSGAIVFLLWLGFVNLPATNGNILKCPNCKKDTKLTVHFEYAVCPYCGHKFLTCYPDCDVDCKDGYYCQCFCPYQTPPEDDGDDEYYFD